MKQPLTTATKQAYRRPFVEEFICRTEMNFLDTTGTTETYGSQSIWEEGSELD